MSVGCSQNPSVYMNVVLIHSIIFWLKRDPSLCLVSLT